MTKRQTQVSFFASLCLFLSAVEYAIPKPLPFMRLGLANLPLLLALRIFSPVDIFLLIGLKILGQALISGTLFSYVFVFSASGSIASGAAMFLLYNLFAKKNKMSNIGLCLAGSLSNNAAQLAVSRFLIFGENTKYIAPLLFTSGLISALLLGIFSNVFCKKSKWYDALLSGNVNFFCKANEAIVANATGVEDGASVASGASVECGTNETSCTKIEGGVQKTNGAKWAFVFAMVMFLVFLLHDFFLPKTLPILFRVLIVWSFVFVFYLLVCVKRKKLARFLPSIFITMGITFFALLTPSGKVLVMLGKFKITEDALLLGLRKSGVLVGMVFLSQFAISPRLTLPGKVGNFLASMFSFFDNLTSTRVSFSKGNIIETLDKKLYEASNTLSL